MTPTYTLVTDPAPDDLYTLANNEIACHPFEAADDEAALVTFFHSLSGQRQDFSVRVWFSDEPNGDPLYTVPIAYRQIHPLAMACKFAVYADQADVTVTGTEWDAEFGDAIWFDTQVERRPRREFPEHITVVTGKVGTYWVNFQNLTGRDNGYYLKMLRSPLDF
jgi:hypothetical protein